MDCKNCKHKINKTYNYGFSQGTASYCKKYKKWISDMKKCPDKQQ